LQLICAFATDDKKCFSKEHFGDAKFYLLYTFSKDGMEFIEQFDNTSIEVEGHAVPEKAQSVTSLLKEKGVQVLVARFFGPNIKRVKAHFVPVIIKKLNIIQESLTVLQDNFDAIQLEWKQDSSERKHIIL